MKKNISNWLMLLGILSLAVFSCESDQDTFNEFVSDGERVTVGAVQNIMVSLGVGKIKMDVAINADPKIKKFILKDGEQEISILDLVRNKDGADTVSYILDLDEKLYNFNIRSVDDDGNESVPYEFVTTVYGDKYIANLSSRKVTDLTFDADAGIATVWLSVKQDRMKETILTYTDRNDVVKVISVANEDTNVEISDFKLGTTISVQSTYLPPLQEGEASFEDFVSLQINVDEQLPFPICEGAAVAVVSLTSMDFGQLNNGQVSAVQSFTVQSGDCFLNNEIYVNTPAPFGASLSMTGPFESSLLVGDISLVKTVYVQFDASAGKNQIFNGELKVEGANITAPPIITLAGEEIGNSKTGLHILGPDEWPFATVGLPDDSTPRLDWGGLFHEAFFDGDPFTIGHSQAGDVPGATFTIDLAKNYEIVKAGWFIRADKCCGGDRAIKRYQIWGLPDGMDVMAAATTVALTPTTETEWGQEMLANGWKNMVNASLTVNPNEGDGRVTHDVPAFTNVRYIRVAVFEAFTADTFDFGEIELTADFGL